MAPPLLYLFSAALLVATGPASVAANTTAYELITSLQSQLFSSYDSAVPPQVKPMTPFVVQTLIGIYKVLDVNIQDSTASFALTVQLLWNDPRLAWNTSEVPLPYMPVRASNDAEQTQVWVPDFDLYNQVDGGLGIFADKAALVNSEGWVLWRRMGTLKVLCTFSGLERMPFDTLICEMIYGPWSSGNFQAIYEPLDPDLPCSLPGIHFGTTPGMLDNYQEFKLVCDETVADTIDVYVFKFNADAFQFQTYELHMKRSSKYFVVKAVLPNALFAYLSFGMLLVDVRSGERLSYGITLILAIIASDMTLSTYLPIATETFWLPLFINISFFFACLALIESIFVVWLYWKDNTDHGENRKSALRASVLADSLRSATLDAMKEEESQSAFKLFFKSRCRSIVRSSSKSVVRATQRRNEENVLITKWLDRVFFWIFFVTYTLFWILMAATNKHFEDKKMMPADYLVTEPFTDLQKQFAPGDDLDL